MRDVIFHNISINIIITLTLSLSIGQHRMRFHLTSNALGSASANYCTQPFTMKPISFGDDRFKEEHQGVFVSRFLSQTFKLAAMGRYLLNTALISSRLISARLKIERFSA